MHRLNNKNLPAERSDVSVFCYDRNTVSNGIVHFGVGNFHRTHQAIYCEDLLCQGESKWGISGVSLRSTGMRDALAPQDFLYTQVTLGGQNSYRVVGALNTVLVAPQDPAAVIAAVANSTTQLVTTTITEKAYYLAAGAIDFEHSDLLADSRSLAAPKTVFGYLAAAIIQRKRNSGAPLTVMCCDNIRSGGAHLQRGVDRLLAAHCNDSQRWATQQVSFISSMVDRISPATDTALKTQLANSLELIDEWPVGAEPFSQWVIEDNFRAERPPFDRVGALFVEDVAPYEEMKLRLLNAAHSAIAVLGYLSGDHYINEALQRSDILNFVKHWLLNDVVPVIEVPCGWDAHDYTEQIMLRFSNAAIPYSVQQVNTDSSQKIRQRWLSTVAEALKQGKGATGYAFALAAWIYYIHQSATGDDLQDPLASQLRAIIDSGHQVVTNIINLLDNGDTFQLNQHEPFIARVNDHFDTMLHQGLPSTLAQWLVGQSHQY